MAFLDRCCQSMARSLVLPSTRVCHPPMYVRARLIILDWGDTIRVTVVNRLTDNGYDLIRCCSLSLLIQLAEPRSTGTVYGNSIRMTKTEQMESLNAQSHPETPRPINSRQLSTALHGTTATFQPSTGMESSDPSSLEALRARTGMKTLELLL